MTQKTVNYSIIPIFNQAAPMVWDDFVRIENQCDKVVYGLGRPCDNVIKRRISTYRANLRRYRHNFAFGAYINKQMIGFIQGYSIDTNEAFINHLYVLPKYHRWGIGTQLLHAAEQTAAIIANKISLVSSSLAVDFYEQKHGYTKSGRDMEKELSPVANAVVPVFQWIKQDFKVKCVIPTDTRFLKQEKFRPIFVHTNAEYKIDTILFSTDADNKLRIPINQPINYQELIKNLVKTK